MADIHSIKLKRLYWVWASMIQRCTNQNNKQYKNYGARGIKVCDKWRNSFNDFFQDMGLPKEGLTLERKNNDLGYSLDNCYWASRNQQMINRRLFVTNKSGIKGIEYRNYDAFRVRARRNKKIVLDITVNDFFEACCIKKSFELNT